jgi:sugar phosphate permease
MFIPGNVISLGILNTKGFRACISTGAILLIIGTWIRLLVYPFGNFFFVLGGSVFASSAQAFMQNPVAKMATTWFGDKERGLATAFGSMAMPMGCLISFLLPNLFFDTTFDKYNFNMYLFVQTLLITALCVPSIFFLRDEPPSPPTVLLKDGNSRIEMSMGQSIKALFRNRNYVLLFFSFIFLYGLYCAIAGVLNSFTAPYGYSPGDLSVICLVFSISGILNSFIIGLLLDRYQCYKKALLALCISSIFALSLSALTLPSGRVGFQAIAMMWTGASMIPVVTICFSFAAELSYPVPESNSIGFMISVAQIFGFLLGLALSAICSIIGPLIGIAIWVVCATLAALFAGFV